MGKIEHLPWRICNNSEAICELTFIEEPYAGSIFIREDDILATCREQGEVGHIKKFDKGINIKKVEMWIKEKLNLKQ